MKLITPKDAALQQRPILPEKIAETFNLLISKNFDGESAVVKLTRGLLLFINDDDKADIWSLNQFNILFAYRDKIIEEYNKAGWEVTYEDGSDKTYDSFFRFTAKSR